LAAAGFLMTSLYADADLYGRVFPLDAGDVDFYSELLGPVEGPLVDLGGGAGELAAALSVRLSVPAVTVDLAPWIPRDGVLSVRGDLRALPMRGPVGGLVSRLFGVGYAMAQGSVSFAGLLAPGARAVLELPLAWEPRRLQGLEESAEIAPDLTYRFRYLDVLRDDALGAAVLDTLIEVGGREVHAPLWVPTPVALRAWVGAQGWRFVGVCAAGDAGSLCSEPPRDCLRAVVVAEAGL